MWALMLHAFMARLTGPELLAYAQDNEGQPIDDLIKGAGYYREVTGEDGDVKIQINRQPFWQALAIAQGIVKVSAARTVSSGGKTRARKYRVKSNDKSGNIVITGGYLEEIGGRPGEYFRLEIVEDTGELVVIRENGDEEAKPATSAPELVAA
jgi:hypothetical protein